MYRFDEAGLRGQLETLQLPSRMVFAAACAQRLRSAANEGSSAPEEQATGFHQTVIRRLVEVAAGDPVSRNELEAMLHECMALLPDDEDAVDDERDMLRDDATATLAYALRAGISGVLQEAVWAARRAYEAADRHALRASSVSIGDAETEAQLLAHPTVQRELANQATDLKALQSLSLGPSARDSVQKLLQLAWVEGGRFLQV